MCEAPDVAGFFVTAAEHSLCRLTQVPSLGLDGAWHPHRRGGEACQGVWADGTKSGTVRGVGDVKSSVRREEGRHPRGRESKHWTE